MNDRELTSKEIAEIRLKVSAGYKTDADHHGGFLCCAKRYKRNR